MWQVRHVYTCMSTHTNTQTHEHTDAHVVFCKCYGSQCLTLFALLQTDFGNLSRQLA
jgi:hypothetical protein